MLRIRIRRRTFFLDPYLVKSNKFNRYFCEQFTFFKINQQILKKEDEDKEGEGKDEDEGEDEDEDEDEDKEDGDEDEDEDKEE